jgi:heat shock protein HslJ
MIPWLAITGCVAEESGPNGTWQLASIDSSLIAATSEDRLPHFTITDKTIEGFDGCNQFSGPIDRPGAISATRRACPDLKNRLPMDLNALDAHFQSAKVEGDTMTVPARGDYPESTYTRMSASKEG